jgi:hypothetical protein
MKLFLTGSHLAATPAGYCQGAKPPGTPALNARRRAKSFSAPVGGLKAGDAAQISALAGDSRLRLFS